MCLGCGAISGREALQTRFVALNPDWSAQAGAVAPDGDVFLEDEQVLNFRVPSCEDCGGILKPEVTFFGDTVNKATVAFVHERLVESDAVLVVGSSLQVHLRKMHRSLWSLHHKSFVLLYSFVSLSAVSRCIQDTGSYWQRVTGKCQLPF